MSTVQLAARPTKVMTSSASCLASCAPLPSWMTIWRHRGTESGFRQRLEVEPADEIEQRLVLGANAGELHALVDADRTGTARPACRGCRARRRRASARARASTISSGRLPGVGERGDVKVARQRESIAVAADDNRRRGRIRGKVLRVCGRAGHGSSVARRKSGFIAALQARSTLRRHGAHRNF